MMTFDCACGQVTFEVVEGGKLAITSEGGIITATVVPGRDPNVPSVKLEHLQCNTCRTVLVGE